MKAQANFRSQIEKWENGKNDNWVKNKTLENTVDFNENRGELIDSRLTF